MCPGCAASGAPGPNLSCVRGAGRLCVQAVPLPALGKGVRSRALARSGLLNKEQVSVLCKTPASPCGGTWCNSHSPPPRAVEREPDLIELFLFSRQNCSRRCSLRKGGNDLEVPWRGHVLLHPQCSCCLLTSSPVPSWCAITACHCTHLHDRAVLGWGQAWTEWTSPVRIAVAFHGPQ